jgi:hypothetical protein
MNLKDLVMFIVIFIVIILLAVKTVRDYKLLTSDNHDNIYVSPRSFIWKGGLFFFVAIGLIPFSARRDISTYLMSFCLLGIALWNVYYAVKYKNYMKKN